MKKYGWIKSIRSSKELIFLAITDGSKDFQLTIKEGIHICGELKVGASVVADGVDSITPRGMYEFLVSDLKIIGVSDDTYPIQPKSHSQDFLRTIPELRGRTKGCQAVWQMRSIMSLTLHQTLSDFGYFQYFTPIVTFADCEGAGQTFDITSDWLQQKLTVSGQLHLEVGMMSLGKVYTFGPCFRAEKSTTKKHLSEFWMLECEGSHLDLDATMDLSEQLIKSVLKKCLERSDLLKMMEIDDSHIKKVLDVWPRILYSDICERYKIPFGTDISSDIEAKIVKDAGGPVFITHYAKDLKPFYMKKIGDTAVCFDLLFPEVGELIGGSEREDSYDILKEEMIASCLDMSKMDWYLKTRKWGSVPHSGFGLGFDRLVMYICKLQKIHDAIPFPIAY